DLPVEVAGKTGTAQHDKRKQDHAWFISFAPYSQPRIATVVLVEQGGEGSKAAVPVTKKILQWYFENR
ncbi:MAG TPA: penicillin-binding transpeptidase domain-containing protein, partial [bacterium]|nr:penicillin-binding transpeptidase domain-containing protein [bacterium]